MCFSPEGDLVGGVVVVAIGVDALRHLRRRNDHVALAALPLLLGFHQIDEAFVWWGLQGLVPHGVGRVAMWIYLLIAFVVLPIFVPIVIMLLEPTARRRWRISPSWPSALWSRVVLLATMVRNHPNVTSGRVPSRLFDRAAARNHHIGLYIVATCGRC